MMIVAFLTLMVAAWQVSSWLERFWAFRRDYKELRKLAPTDVDDSRLCTEPHRWVESPAMTPDRTIAQVTVCAVCGFVPSRNIMASQYGLERILRNLTAREEEDIIEREFLAVEERCLRDQFKEEIENGLNFSKIVAVHKLGQTVNTRYLDCKRRVYERVQTKIEGGSDE